MLIRELLQEPDNGKSTNNGKQQLIQSTEKLSFQNHFKTQNRKVNFITTQFINNILLKKGGR
jgi:hypothetical protein